MSFQQPAWLLLMLLAIPTAIAAWRWLRAMGPLRRTTAILTRTALIALISGMLAGASAVRTTDRMAVVAIVDVSGSVQRFAARGRDGEIGAAVRGFLEAGAGSRGPDDLMGLVVFDGVAAAVAAPTRVDVSSRPLDVSMVDGSDLAAALRLASAMLPADAAGRIIIFSDGVETTGDGFEAAKKASAAGGRSAGRPTPIDVVPINYEVASEVLVEAVEAPTRAPAGATIAVRVVLNSSGPASGLLYLLREGEQIDLNGGAPGAGRPVVLRGGRHVETVNVDLDATRLHRFEAIFEPARTDGGAANSDTVMVNNRAQAVTLSPGRGAILVVDGVSAASQSGPGAILPRTLASAGLEVETVAPSAMPRDILGLQAYDLVILNDVPSDDLPIGAEDSLVVFVTELGGGLVMVGGPSSFGAGGWKGTPVEPILPVLLDLPERMVVPTVAIVIVLDNSGSMGRSVMGSSRSQQEVANEGAALAVKTLDPTDLVGVISFNSEPHVEAPLGPNTGPDRTADRIRAIRSGGGTNLPPALALARQKLAGVKAEIKHVIVLSDGRSESTESLVPMAVAMRSEGIRVSTIAVGDDADLSTMREVAARGGGEYYPVVDPNVLPRIFVKAVRVVRTPMVRLGDFDPVVTGSGSPVVEGVGRPPSLGGITMTQPRPDPTVVNAMIAPAEGEVGPLPLLSYWNAGLGKVAAFTSDSHDWASRWVNWPGYARTWTQLARLVARPAADRTSELTTELVGDKLTIRLDAADESGRPLDLLEVHGSVYGPGGERIATRLVQTGSGIYEATTPAAGAGNYVVTLTPRAGGVALSPVIGAVSKAGGVEYRRLSSDQALLRRIAEATGGRVHDLDRPGDADLFDRSGVEPVVAREPLWRVLLAWTVLVMLLDVATRRIAWDRFASSRLRALTSGDPALETKARAEAAARAAAALRTARSRQDEGDGSRALTSDDARAIVREQARLRRERGRLAPPRPTEPAPPPAPPPPPGAPSQRPARANAPSPAGSTSELLSAKRRARERMEKRDDE